MSLIAFKSFLFIREKYTMQAQVRKHGRLDARLGGLRSGVAPLMRKWGCGAVNVRDCLYPAVRCVAALT